MLKNDRDFSIEVALRGLTGMTTVGEIRGKDKAEDGKGEGERMNGGKSAMNKKLPQDDLSPRGRGGLGGKKT